MRALIIGSGQYVPLEDLKKDLARVDRVIAIDGGLNHLVKIGARPNVFIGDQDSTDKSILENFDFTGIELIKFKAEKDKTDMDLGLDYVIENRFSQLIIYGATGTRLDHSLANIFLLEKLHRHKIQTSIVDLNNRIQLVEKSLSLRKTNKTYISVLALGDSGLILSLKGFKYPLDKHFIPFGATIGLSNEIVDDLAYIEVGRGLALVFVSRD